MDKELLSILNDIAKTDILNVVITFVLAAIVILLLRTVAEAAAGFIQLRLDQHLAIGSLVEIYGKKGFIKEVSLFTITIETEYEFIRVPTKQWRFTEMLILKGCGPLPDRRKDDEKKKITNENGETKVCVCKFTNKI